MGVNRASICVRGVAVSYKRNCATTCRRPGRDHGGMGENVPSVPGSSRDQSRPNESRQSGLLGSGGVPVTRQKSDRGRRQTRKENGQGWLWAGDSAYDKSDRRGSRNHACG